MEAAYQRGAERRRDGAAAAAAAVPRRLCDLHSRTPPPSQEPLRAAHDVAEHGGSMLLDWHLANQEYVC